MPTYDYKCEECDKVFEEFHGMTEEPEVICPICGGSTRRMIGGGLGVIFKGSGFYVNDSSSRSSSSTAIGSSTNRNDTPSDDNKDPAKETAASDVTAEKKETVESSAS